MPALPKASALLLLAASCLQIMRAQDAGKRGTQHPLFPPACVQLKAAQSSVANDTAAVQSALNVCTTGKAVELTQSDDGHHSSFFLTHITLPAGVTLLLDAGVTVSIIPASDKARAPIDVAPSAATASAGLMGFGILDAHMVAKQDVLIDAQGPLDLFKLTIREPPANVVRSSSSEALHIEDAKFIGARSILLGSTIPQATILNSTIATTHTQCALASDLPCANPALPRASAELYATAADTLASVDLTATTDIRLNAVVILPDTAAPVPADDLVVFYDGNRQLGTASITNTVAQLSVSALAPGTHHITAF